MVTGWPVGVRVGCISAIPAAARYCFVKVAARLFDPVRPGHATAVSFALDYLGSTRAETKAHAGHAVPRAAHLFLYLAAIFGNGA